MKKIIILFIILQLSTLLWADKSFSQYLKIKKVAYELYESQNKDEAILYVKEFIHKNPKNIRAQNLLAVFYFWRGDYKKSKYILNNILKKEQFPQAVSLLKKIQKKDGIAGTKQNIALNKRERAYKKLDEFYINSEYNRFMNLYISLENSGAEIPTRVHVNALYSAIELGLYEKAKSIMYIYRLPNNRYIAEIEDLIDEKLLFARFTTL